MKKIVLLQKIMMVSMVFGMHSLLLASEDRLVDTMHSLHEKIGELSSRNTSCCFIPNPFVQMDLGCEYRQTMNDHFDGKIPKERELFNIYKNNKPELKIFCISLMIGGCVCLPIALTVPAVPITGVAGEVMTSIASCSFVGSSCCALSNLHLYTYQYGARRQFAIKQLHTQGHVDDEYKKYLKSNENAFYMRDCHENMVYDK